MDLFKKLFPFQSLFTSDENSLTAWWILMVLLFFLSFSVLLWYTSRGLLKKIPNRKKDFSKEDLQKDEQLSRLWKDYQETFFKLNHEDKTDKPSSQFFSFRGLMSSNRVLRLVSWVPSTLVGLGILGTFVGLTVGISNFHTGSTEQIKESIETLLSGMGTAFITSIHGMFTSIVFSLLLKWRLGGLQFSIYDFCYSLDKKYLISKEDERQIVLQRQEETLKDLFLYTDDAGNTVKPGNVLRDIFKQTQQQSIALQSFSTDLADLITEGFEKIINDPDKGVVHELEGLKAEIINLGSKLQDPASEMTQNIVKDLENSMTKMLEEFKTSLSGSAKTEMESLSKLLGEASSSLNGFPEKLETMTNKLNSDFASLQEVVGQIAQQVLRQTEESTGKMGRQVTELSNILKTNIGEIQVGQEILIDKQTQNIQVSETLLSSFNNSIDSLNNLSGEIRETVSSFLGVQDGLQNASTQLKGITDNVLTSTGTFKEAQTRFSEQSKEFVQENAQVVNKIQQTLSQASELSENYSEKFIVIENGLQDIFKQIGTGLDDYQTTVSESLNNFLSQYTESLNKAAQALSGASEKQEEILEELTEQLSKFHEVRL